MGWVVGSLVWLVGWSVGWPWCIVTMLQCMTETMKGTEKPTMSVDTKLVAGQLLGQHAKRSSDIRHTVMRRLHSPTWGSVQTTGSPQPRPKSQSSGPRAVTRGRCSNRSFGDAEHGTRGMGTGTATGPSGMPSTGP